MIGGDFIQPIEEGKPVFGGAPIAKPGILSVSFRVDDVDVGIEQAQAVGMRLRSRVGSEDIGLGKNVVQAQFVNEGTFGLALEIVERQIPGDPHLPLTETVVDHVEHYTRDVDAAAAFFGGLFGTPFEDAFVDPVRGGRSRRHARFGIQLTEAAEAAGGDGIVARRLADSGEGLQAIAFKSDELDRDIDVATGVGLRLVGCYALGDGSREAEFEPEAGVVIKLVERR